MRKEFGYYRVNYPVLGEPLVSVIVEAKEPFGNSSENASKKVKEYCDRLVQMLQKAGYEHFEVLVPVFSVEIPEKMESLKEIDRRNRIRVVYCDKNRETLSFPGELVADKAKGEVLCFLDAKVCDVSNGWMRELLGTVLRPGVGVAAGCVRDKNGRIVQAGYSLYNKEETRPDFAGLKKGHTGYMNRADLQRDVFAGASVLVVRREACLAVAVTGEAAVAVAKAAAVTGEAAVAVTKAAAVTGEAAVAVTKAEAVTGKTASGEAADIALCARLQKAGWRICYTPYVAVTVEEK